MTAGHARLVRRLHIDDCATLSHPDLLAGVPGTARVDDGWIDCYRLMVERFTGIISCEYKDHSFFVDFPTTRQSVLRPRHDAP